MTKAAAVESFYIATVWMGPSEYEAGKVVIRLRATDVKDYRARVRELWPTTFQEIGPVSVSKVQE